jgi:hypothetical protein
MCCATRPRDGLGVGDAEAALTSGLGASVGLPAGARRSGTGAPHRSAAGPERLALRPGSALLDASLMRRFAPRPPHWHHPAHPPGLRDERVLEVGELVLPGEWLSFSVRSR